MTQEQKPGYSSLRSLNRLENELRRSATKKNEAIENFVFDLNDLLAADPLNLDADRDPDFPLILITGAPRSGTTLLYQYLCSALEIGFVDAIAARFWRKPSYGIRLSRSLSQDKPLVNYESSYGTPNSPFGPHEFSYFWRHWLRLDEQSPTEKYDREPDIDWPALRREFAEMQGAWDLPMVFKGMNLIGGIKHFVANVPRVFFIHIERNLLDNAASLLSARKHYYGTTDTWWSLYPPEYDTLKDLPPEEQVVGQIHYLNKQFRKELESLDRVPSLFVDYREFCDSPTTVLDTIRQQCAEHFNYEFVVRPSSNVKFAARTTTLSFAAQARIAQAIESLDTRQALPPAPIASTNVEIPRSARQRTRYLLEQNEVASGNEVARLEDELSDYFQGQHFACVSSAFAALQIVLTSLREQYSTVSVPAFVSETLLAAALQAKFDVILLDVDGHTMNLTSTPQETEILVAPHLFGLPAPLPDLSAHLVIEDVSHAPGASTKLGQCGTLGGFSIYSFDAPDLLGGIWGGAISSHNESAIEQFRDIRQTAQQANFRQRFQYPLSDISAAVVRQRLADLDQRNAKRAEVADYYRSKLSNLDVGLPSISHERVWSSFTVQTVCARALVAAGRQENIGIDWVQTVGPLAKWQTVARGTQDCKITERLCKETIYLPFHENLSLADAERVSKLIEQVVGHSQ